MFSGVAEELLRNLEGLWGSGGGNTAAASLQFCEVGCNQGLVPLITGLKVSGCPPQRWNPSLPREHHPAEEEPSTVPTSHCVKIREKRKKTPQAEHLFDSAVIPKQGINK